MKRPRPRHSFQMAYRFMKNETLPHGIRRVFAEEIDWAVGQLTSAKSKREPVHEARKSMKKIRALLGLIKSSLGGKYRAEDRHFRKVGRLLSEVRDGQVVLDVFDELSAKDGEMDASARQEIRHNLERGKRDAKDEKQICSRVAQLLSNARLTQGQWPLEGLEFDELLPDLVAVYKRGKGHLQRVAHAASADAFHNFRKAVKQHWYHLKLLESVWDPEMKQRAAGLRDLETCLGDEHNLTVLRERIEADVETRTDRRHAQHFIALLDDRVQALRERALESGQRLYTAKPREFSKTLANLWAEPQSLRKRPARAPSKARSAVA